MRYEINLNRDDGTIRPLREIELELLYFVVDVLCDGSMSKAARSLRVGRATLYRKIGSIADRQAKAELEEAENV